MFDYLHCEYPLPGVDINVTFDKEEEVFQTKDFDCLMEHYTITKDGRIVHHTVRMEAVPEEERPYYGKPQWKKGGMYQLAGCMRSVSTGDVYLDITDTIHFYTTVGDVNSNNWDWYEWEAKFVDGKLKSVTRVTDRH